MCVTCLCYSGVASKCALSQQELGTERTDELSCPGVQQNPLSLKKDDKQPKFELIG